MSPSLSGLGRPRSRTGASSLAEEDCLHSESAWGGRERAFSNTTFLVCVHNVSDAQPYAILRAPVNSTAFDIIVQVLHKARRMETPDEFVLVEETGEASSESPPPPKMSVGSGPEHVSNFRAFKTRALLLTSQLRDRSPSSVSGRSWVSSISARSDCGTISHVHADPKRRALLNDENVCTLQNQWKSYGRFLLKTRAEFEAELEESSPKTRKKSLMGMRSLNFGRSSKK